MNNYVPHGTTEKPVPIISAGDQLTCEREDNAQEGRRGCPPAERWSGMLPEIADFHALANFYEVCCKVNNNDILHSFNWPKYHHSQLS